MKFTLVFLLVSTVGGTLAPPVLAQGGVPAIRVEVRQVLVPAFVGAKYNGGYYRIMHLAASDFHLFEDGKEQKIESIALERTYRAVFQDNVGIQDSWALTAKGKWSRLSDNVFGTPAEAFLYVIAYTPPPSSEGSCHQVKIKVDQKDATGKRLIAAELGPVLFKDGWHNPTVEVDRRNLLIDARTEYCNVQHSSSDTLYGTKISKQMESVASADPGRGSRLQLRAIDFPEESGSVRVRIVLDFPAIMRSQSGVPSLLIGVLGMVYGKSGVLAARFSESLEAGCPFEGLDARVCRQQIPNHYETEIPLPSGEYDLRVVLDAPDELSGADTRISVRGYELSPLALSGIALCQRFYRHSERPQNELALNQVRPQDSAVDIPPELVSWFKIPTMPFELEPLVSKGIEFTPTGDSRFKKKEALIAYFDVYAPLVKGSGAVNVQFQMRIKDVKTGELKTDTGLRPADSFLQAGKTVVPIAEQIAIDKLPKGEYRLEVQASDSAGNHTDWRTTSFIVE